MKNASKFRMIVLLPIIILSFVLLLSVLGFLWRNGVFVTDRSAAVYVEGMEWNGKAYSTVSGDYTEGRTIAKSEVNNWHINEVEEDPSHTFVVARSFLDQRLYVADEYTVPKSGEITKVSWNRNYISDETFLAAMTKIDAEKVTSFEYETEGIYMLTAGQHMRTLYFAYEGCPIATEFKGYMGKIHGKWAITTYISPEQRDDDGSPKPYRVSCYTIPEEYASILETYFE